MGSFCFF